MPEVPGESKSAELALRSVAAADGIHSRHLPQAEDTGVGRNRTRGRSSWAGTAYRLRTMYYQNILQQLQGPKSSMYRRNKTVADGAIIQFTYSLLGCQFGFLFCANAVKPSLALSPVVSFSASLSFVN